MIIGLSGYSGTGKDTIGAMIQMLHCDSLGNHSVNDIISNYKDHEWWLDDESGWEIRKWAGKLKYIATTLTGIPTSKFEDQEFKKTYLPDEWNYYTISLIDNGKLLLQHGRFTTKQEAEDFIPMLKETFGEFRMDYVVGMQRMTVRQFLQELGTDGLRNGLHPNTWVNSLMVDYDTESLRSDKKTNWIITDTRFPNEAQAIKDAGGIVIRVDRPGIKAINAHSSETGLDKWTFDYKIMNGSDIVSLMFSVNTILKKENLI